MGGEMIIGVSLQEFLQILQLAPDENKNPKHKIENNGTVKFRHTFSYVFLSKLL